MAITKETRYFVSGKSYQLFEDAAIAEAKEKKIILEEKAQALLETFIGAVGIVPIEYYEEMLELLTSAAIQLQLYTEKAAEKKEKELKANADAF
jgi:hypothetical protein